MSGGSVGVVEVQLHALLTSILDGGGQLHALADLPSGKELPVPTGQ
jgi:hypothetical protein